MQDVIARGPRDRDLEAPLERGARVKRRPHWLNNTVDPALAAQNRITLTNECEEGGLVNIYVQNCLQHTQQGCTLHSQISRFRLNCSCKNAGRLAMWPAHLSDSRPHAQG